MSSRTFAVIWIYPEELPNSSLENEISPRRGEIKLRKNEIKVRRNEMKVRRNEMKVRRNWPVLPWRICISSGENPFSRKVSEI